MCFKQLNVLFTFFLTFSLFAQEPAQDQGGSIHIEGLIVGAENQQVELLNKNIGGWKSAYFAVETDDEGKFVMDTSIAVEDYFFIKTENGQMLNLILRPGDSLRVYGDTRDLLGMTNVLGPEDSGLLNAFLREYRTFKQTQDSLTFMVRRNPQLQQQVNAYFSPIAQQFYSYRNNFVNQNRNSPALVGVLNSLDQAREWEAYKQIVLLLEASFGKSPTIQKLTDYVERKDVQMKAQAAAQAKKEAMFEPGTEVQDIIMPDTSGTVIKLSDLRGKVVLIDFWASWCKPCRRENPNVVKAYQKYNKDGFEVFSVSLDKKGFSSRWKAAIEQDGLLWPYHVSTLEGFATKAARDYAVNSIPFTVLIDEEGKVIATNLRGAQLEQELQRIFGH
jgi:thiol-disulfide isomerase/thioredoxin